MKITQENKFWFLDISSKIETVKFLLVELKEWEDFLFFLDTRISLALNDCLITPNDEAMPHDGVDGAWFLMQKFFIWVRVLTSYRLLKSEAYDYLIHKNKR